MAKQEYSDYQKDVISNYYKNINTIMLQKVSDLVGELFLVESETKAEKLWKKVHAGMKKLNVPESIINHIMEKKDISILAKNLQEWQSKSGN